MEFISRTAIISEKSILGSEVKIWDSAQIREGAKIGNNSIIGRNVYIDCNVSIGNNCKIQNSAMIYDSAILHDGVFIGPGVILTNDKNPRAINMDLTLKSVVDWDKVGVEIEEGASIGAGTICVAPIKIGAWSLVGAGSVVVKNVSKFALVVGSPAKQIGWVGRLGKKLDQIDSNIYQCPVSKNRYVLNGTILNEEI